MQICVWWVSKAPDSEYKCQAVNDRWVEAECFCRLGTGSSMSGKIHRKEMKLRFRRQNRRHSRIWNFFKSDNDTEGVSVLVSMRYLGCIAMYGVDANLSTYTRPMVSCC